ncbi:borneol dehydrogenase, mitochondrial-like [Mercurialis annua]|uniref:borneol dehydrogenase, mitochondrial-like n=1 Tax=Mercurialis annua TaxID=3986 RepID=UPI00215ED507|nr:borneol dehydrogenase, mitochondrial-like [Mercurialis annua]
MATNNILLLAGARRLEGKVAVITGAATAIGECIARTFCKHGAKVVIADIQDELGQSVANDLGHDVAKFIHCDVTVESDVEKAVNTAISIFGKLDIMVNNAAVADPRKSNITDNHLADFERVVKVDLIGPFLCTKHAARVMIPARQGSIITIGSVSSSTGGVASHAYTSAKHGTIGLVKNAAAELGQYGIRVNCVSPYFIETPLSVTLIKQMEEEGRSGGVYSNLKGVKLKQEDVADAVVYLASDESKYISGHNLAVDGGFTTINPAFGLFSRY